MKYIRTKDVVYENNGLMQSNSTVEENSIIVCGGHFAIPISKIIRQADTIKELCDEFVICEKPFYLQPYIWAKSLKKLFAKNIVKNMKSLSIEVYGAIWIKGEHNEPILKPVAKMNDKGELELL